MPALSIITINLNNADGLKRTIQSVISQTFEDFEYIVIDGASTDGSVEVIRTYQDKITKWISEKDTGIYNAMNRGIRCATGGYCLFLNSGDYLCTKDILQEVFGMEPVEDIVYGNMYIEESNGQKRLGKMPDKITLEHMIKDTLWHPVSFIKRKLFNEYGYYREDLKIVSDYDFFLKSIIVHKVTTRHIPLAIAVFDLKGASSLEANQELIRAERRTVQLEYIDKNEIEQIQLKINENVTKPLNTTFIGRVRRWLKR